MTRIASTQGALAEWGRSALAWCVGWWQIIHLGALIFALALSPASYGRANRFAMARHLYLSTAPILPWFTLLSTLISLVLIRIVVVTAYSYGLSQYALEMVVRVLVLELIPLTAALFVALRCTIPDSADLAAMRARGELDALRAQGVDPLRREVLPRVAGGAFAVLMLAAVSCVVTLVLAYLSVHGFTLGGFEGYTRTVGRVFNPAVSLIFALKILFLGLAVSLVPIASVLYDLPPSVRPRTSVELHGLVRMFMAIVLIEGVSLVGNYY
ncbi:MAG TPA: ABC transporter permease [Albitalea sp.]|nr:ABC transporter permease [Albitalea sp.]